MIYVKKYILSIVTLVIGVSIGFLLDKDKLTSPNSIREENSGFEFINPLLFVDYEIDQEDGEYGPLNKSISNYIDEVNTEDNKLDISIYFRKLNEGKSISINPEKTYSPSSMLKVVNAVTVLRAAESDPNILKEKVLIKGNDTSSLQKEGSRYAPKEHIRSGNVYNVEELLEYTIKESDNFANEAVKKIAGEERLAKTYEDLHMPQIDLASDRGYTPVYYSHLFRALYNGTYLSRQVSEKALELLSKTSFDKGLVAGVPKGTIVSHKFGVNAFTLGPYAELHDCGIVYYPEHPYFICIMTRGENLVSIENVIRDISKMAWEFVDSIVKKEG